MATASITIEVDANAARAFAASPAEDQRKLQLLLDLRLQELTASPGRPIGLLMDEISRQAEARGLTPAILESLLDGR